VALLCVVDLGDAQFQHWASVADLMREEARTEAEQVIGRAAAQVQRWSGKMPVLYIREGVASEEVLNLIQEDPGISILVLGASTGPQGPGPLITALTQKAVSQLPVPMVIVPGNLSDEELEALT
jgi:nucleotide-binding universal stress UspA family protein